MTVFVDTSAMLALVNEDDSFHEAAVDTWRGISRTRELHTTNAVVFEMIALTQRRYGMGSVRAFFDNYLPSLDIEHVSADVFDAASSAFLRANSRKLSLVDCISFQVMDRRGIRSAFTYDRHFREAGFSQL